MRKLSRKNFILNSAKGAIAAPFISYGALSGNSIIDPKPELADQNEVPVFRILCSLTRPITISGLNRDHQLLNLVLNRSI